MCGVVFEGCRHDELADFGDHDEVVDNVEVLGGNARTGVSGDEDDGGVLGGHHEEEEEAEGLFFFGGGIIDGDDVF